MDPEFIDKLNNIISDHRKDISFLATCLKELSVLTESLEKRIQYLEDWRDIEDSDKSTTCDMEPGKVYDRDLNEIEPRDYP
jgi:hypothetical protein